jgi:hypothetical protein
MGLTRVLVIDFNVDEALIILLTANDIFANESIDYVDININHFLFENKR